MRFTKLLLAAAVASAATPAFAATVDSDTFTVTANVKDTCTLTAPGAVSFADTTDYSRSDNEVSGTAKVWCTNGYAVTMDAKASNGTRSGVLVESGDATNTLGYTITGFSGTFTGTSGTDPVDQDVTITLDAGNPKSGALTDTVTLTLTV